MVEKDAQKPARISVPSLELDMPIDAAKAREIQACLAKGRLKVTVSQVDLGAARLGDGYKYD